MARSNLQIVRSAMEAYERGGFDATAEFAHPDFEMVTLPTHPESGTHSGMAPARDSMESWIGAFEGFESRFVDFIEAGERVVVVIEQRGSMMGSSAELAHRYGVLFTVRDGRIARMEWFHTPDEALAAA